MKLLRQQSGRTDGFTLIEAVTSTAVFAFFIASLLGVYLSTLRLDSRTRAQRAVSDNARFIMEFLAKEVRNGRIDYNAPACGGNVATQTQLCLINQDGESERISAANTAALITGNGTDLVLEKDTGSSSLNSASVRITKLKFLVAPAIDPLTPAKAANEQPRVTVVMEIKAFGSREPVKINVQSTFSENYYPSRE